MMGRSHFVSGAVAFEATSFAVHYDLTQVITGLVVGTCAALLPDIDHQKATVSQTFGPLSVAFSRSFAKIMGGHRAGTHSVVGILMLGGVTEACVMHRHNPFAEALLSLILIVTLAAGVRVLRIPGWIDDMAPIPFVLAVVFLTPLDLRAVPPALMLGCATHVLGDCLTNSGCPILWPFSRDRLKFGLFRTNGKVEKYFVFPMLLVGVYGLGIWRVWEIVSG